MSVNSVSLTLINERKKAPEEYYLAPEKLIEGNPKQTLWMDYTDATGQYFVGVWRSEVGKWNIHYTEEEYCCITDGISVVTDEQGVATRLTQGDEFVIPKGFKGTWEVIETTTKRFVIYEKSN